MVGSEWLAGAAVSAALAVVAAARGALTRAGAGAAVVVGAAVYAGTGPAGFAVLVVFFATSSLLGKVAAGRKAAVKREFAKSDTRDAAQVLANGGVAAASATAFGLTAAPAWAAAFVGAVAAANADTWATELGVLSRREPWRLVPWQRVPRGTSGAVSPAGLAASAAGALVIGAIAASAPAAFAATAPALLTCAALAGIAGALADSLLGATLQAEFRCPACARRSESPVHACGTPAPHVRGLRWLDNDAVNLAATLTGAVTGAASTLA